METDFEEVTPFVGVWIEIRNMLTWETCQCVTPFVGVWIEISCNFDKSFAV